LLPGFKWHEALRPVDKNDIFRDPDKEPSPATKTTKKTVSAEVE
jgi:hypothetical protein